MNLFELNVSSNIDRFIPSLIIKLKNENTRENLHCEIKEQ